MPLTDMVCRKAKGADKPYKLTDSEGLYLFVKPNGSRLWRMNYSFDKKQKTLSFGKYPDVTLTEAREKRCLAKRTLAAGRDPSESIAAVADRGETFKAIAMDWLANKSVIWSAEHVGRVTRRLDQNVYPLLGHRPAKEIEGPEILAVIREIEARGALDVSHRVRGNISEIFQYAIADHRGVTRDPAADIRKALKPSPKVKHRASINPNDLPQFFTRLAAYPGDRQTALAIELMVHVFLRTDEFRWGQWSEIEGDFWRVPAERMKMNREHLVPLTPSARRLLAELKVIAGRSPYIFPSQAPGKGHKPFSENAMLYGLYTMGYHGLATIHGFRGTASTALNESGLFKEDWIEMQLAHEEENEVRGAYNSAQYLKQRTEMMHWYSEFVEAKKIDSLLG